MNPKDADVYNKRGAAYYNKGEYDKAIEDYSKALKLSPKAVFVANVGIAYLGKKNIEDALYWFHKALKQRDQLPDRGEMIFRALRDFLKG